MPKEQEEINISVDRSNNTITHESADSGVSAKKTLEVFKGICEMSKGENGVDVEEAKRLVSLFCQINETLNKESRATHAQIHENKAAEHQRKLDMFKAKADIVSGIVDKTIANIIALNAMSSSSVSASRLKSRPAAVAK